MEAAKAKEAARLLHAEAQRLTQQATYPEPEPEPETEPDPDPDPDPDPIRPRNQTRNRT